MVDQLISSVTTALFVQKFRAWQKPWRRHFESVSSTIIGPHRRWVPSWCLAFMLALFFAPASNAQTQPALTGNTAIHDPTVVVQNGHFATFATGVEGANDGGTPRTKTSPDGVVWTESGAMPGGMPAWIVEELGFTPRNIWAPSISEHGDVHYLYYSASSFGKNGSVIGLATNDQFDVSDPTDGWVDQGMVVRSNWTNNFNAIDPFRIDTTDGKAWLAFGSHWDGIRLVGIDPVSGKLLDSAVPVAIASRQGGAIEAPAILEHDERFYLFVSFDACCRGLASTYRIMVGRADTITGPYVDREGVPMLEAGGSELLSTTGRYRGPGGQEVFMRDGEPWLAYHYYDRNAGGAPKLQITALHFDGDGWPYVDPLPQN